MASWSDRAWFITGASRGFGRAMAEAVLARGGHVVATARSPASLADLVDRSDGRCTALALDVTDAGQVAEVARATDALGGVDVLFNNAGYGFLGGVEESSDAEIEAQFAVNLFGAMRMVRALLPGMRERGRGGYIVNVSSVAGVRGMPNAAFYAGTKFALEGFSEALSGEVAPFGIGVMAVEPGFFRTDFAGGSIRMAADPSPHYPALAQARAQLKAADGQQPGDPVRGVEAILAAMESEQPPRHLALGADAYAFIRDTLDARRAELETWRSLAESTGFPVAAGEPVESHR